MENKKNDFTMNDIDKLTRLAGLMSYKAEDKADLEPLLEKYGIEKPTKKSCPSCWRDAAILALRAAKKEAAPVDGLPRLRGDAGDPGVYWHWRLVNNDVMTEELAAWLVETDFPEHLYDRQDAEN